MKKVHRNDLLEQQPSVTFNMIEVKKDVDIALISRHVPYRFRGSQPHARPGHASV
jgi:hypothetical protein